MANTIKQKRGTTDPGASDLVVGELAINTTDGGVFTKTDGGSVVEVGAGGASELNDLSDAATSSSSILLGTGVSTSSTENTVVGQDAGANINARKNTYVGYEAGKWITNEQNTAVGNQALGGATGSTQSPYSCTAVGDRALRVIESSGLFNTAVGADAGYSVTSGRSNTLIGQSAGDAITTGRDNVCVGTDSGDDITTGEDNTLLGTNAGDAITTGSNDIVIGNGAAASSATVSNEITLGNTSITSLRIPGLQSGASNGQVLTYNSTDGDLELADVSATVANGCIYENSQTISSNYTISTNKNAMSAGPITVNASVTITIPSGSTYTIV